MSVSGPRKILVLPAVATQFLTVLPVNPGVEVDGELLARSMSCFPLVGLLLGTIDLGAYALLSRVLPPEPTAAIVLLVSLSVTGGLHLDGLADTSDGVFSGRTRERMLEIMRDSRVGSFGVMAIAAFLLVRYSFLSSALQCEAAWALLAPPVLARVAPVLAAWRCDYARSGQGSGRSYTEHVNGWTLAGAVAIAAAVMATLGLGTGRWDMALGVPAIGWGVSWAYNRYIVRKVGGVTGDTFGALLCIGELACLAAVVALGLAR